MIYQIRKLIAPLFRFSPGAWILVAALLVILGQYDRLSLPVDHGNSVAVYLSDNLSGDDSPIPVTEFTLADQALSEALNPFPAIYVPPNSAFIVLPDTRAPPVLFLS